MAINVVYAPDPRLTGQVAFQAGAGQYKQRQDERGDANNRMILGAQLQGRQAQNDYMFRAAGMQMDQAARQQQLAMAREQAIFNANLQAEQAQWEAGMRAQQQERDWQYRLMEGQERLGLARDMGLMDVLFKAEVAGLNNQDGVWGDRRQAMWQEETADQTEKRITGLQAEMAKQQQSLTPEGRAMYGDLSAKLRTIQRQRNTYRPDQYAGLLGQWEQEFEASGVRDHIQAPPTIEDAYSSRVKIDEFGRAHILQPDGKITTVAAPPKSKAAGGPDDPFGAKQPMSAEEFYFNEEPSVYDRDFSKAYKEILAERKKVNPDTGEVSEGSPPNDEEVQQRMRDRFNSRNKFIQSVREKSKSSQVGGVLAGMEAGTAGLMGNTQFQSPQAAPLPPRTELGPNGEPVASPPLKPQPFIPGQDSLSLRDIYKIPEEQMPPYKFAETILSTNFPLAVTYLQQRYNDDVETIMRSGDKDAIAMLALLQKMKPKKPEFGFHDSQDWTPPLVDNPQPWRFGD